MPTDLIAQITSHLEFLGFTCSPVQKLIFAKHPDKPAVAFQLFKGGVLFLTGYSAKKTVMEDRVGFLEFVNRANKDAGIGRFVADFKGEPQLMVEAWYPNEYERTAFGAFFENWISELTTYLEREAETGRKYLE